MAYKVKRIRTRSVIYESKFFSTQGFILNKFLQRYLMLVLSFLLLKLSAKEYDTLAFPFLASSMNLYLALEAAVVNLFRYVSNQDLPRY